jgi:bifunctional polynucleotide phosphatase/kinase
MAGFDLDGTIIKTKSGRRFPKDMNDWQLINDSIKIKLSSLIDNGYTIVIFTNQKNLEKRLGIEAFRKKCKNIQTELGVPMVFYVALINNYMRKPFPGMLEVYNNNNKISLKDSFYVGDAWSKTECFSDSDLCFAKNCNLSFYKAEEFFLSNPKIYDNSYNNLFPKVDYELNELNEFIKDKQYLFIISPPASGKSTFCKKYLGEYIRLSKDDYNTSSKYRKAINKNLEDKLVFDNTNANRDKILSYLKDSDKIGYIIRNISKEQSFYLNKYRHFITKGSVKLLPDVAIHTYYKRVTYPEGDNVFIINSSWINGDNLVKFYC